LIDEKMSQTMKDKCFNSTEEYELHRGYYKTTIVKFEKVFDGYGYSYELTFKGLKQQYFSKKQLQYVDKETIFEDDVEFTCEYKMSKQLELLFKLMSIDFSDRTKTKFVTEWTVVLKTKPTLIVKHCNLDDERISFTESHIQLKNFRVVDIYYDI
jgi:hypothetical protein